MRVLYLNPSGKLGGAETSLLGLFKGLRELHPEWTLYLLLGEEGPMAACAAALSVNTCVLEMPEALARSGDGAPGKLLKAVAATWQYRKRLRDRIREIRPDVIHTNGFKMHILGAWTARPHFGNTAALVCHLHDYVGNRPITKRLMWATVGRFTAVVANSASVAADIKKLPVRKERISSIYNGVDTTRFSPSGPGVDLDRFDGLLPAEPGTVRVGLVATFARWKGHLAFLRAISLLPPTLPVRAYVIGGPIYQTLGSQHTLRELRAEAERLGIEKKTCFTGFIEDPVTAIRTLDIVVHASTEPEPFGMVIIEAMACSKAVIASRSGGAEEIFEDGVNALGHNPGDAPGLAAQIELLARDCGLRARLGASGHRTVVRRFRAETMAERFAEVYLKTAAEVGTGDSLMGRSA